MKIEEAIQSVQSLYSKGVQSKDSRLTSRHIYSTLVSARTTILKQQINKRQKVNDSCYQPLSCIELEKAPIHECPCAPKKGLYILRSKQYLPKIISSLDKPLIQYVIELNGTTRLDRTTFENVKYSSGDKYTGTKPKYYIKNNRLYITVLKMLKAVSANILAEDPLEAYLFSSLCEECDTCKECIDPMQLDFYTDRDSFNSIAKITKDELVVMFGQMREDKNDDASDDIQSAGRMVHQPDNNG